MKAAIDQTRNTGPGRSTKVFGVHHSNEESFVVTKFIPSDVQSVTLKSIMTGGLLEPENLINKNVDFQVKIADDPATY